MSALEKRSFLLLGHATSLALEPEFWKVLEDVAKEQGRTVPKLLEEVDKTRPEGGNFARALRLFALRAVLRGRG